MNWLHVTTIHRRLNICVGDATTADARISEILPTVSQQDLIYRLPHHATQQALRIPAGKLSVKDF